MKIYRNIPRPPRCRAAGTWPPGSRAAGAFPQKKDKKNCRQLPGAGRPAAGRPAPLAARQPGGRPWPACRMMEPGGGRLDDVPGSWERKHHRQFIRSI